MIELGVPFSDPMADGPVIQRASERALKKGVTLHSVLGLAKNLRRKSAIPLVLMGYYNPILQYGLRQFAHDAAAAGVDGILAVDLPVEESRDLKAALCHHKIDLVFLITPTSTPARLRLIEKHGGGFVYYVSLSGVTGAGNLDSQQVKRDLARIGKIISHPVLIGFGISSPEQARALNPLADGIIVGSAIIKKMEQAKTTRQKISAAVTLARQLKTA